MFTFFRRKATKEALSKERETSFLKTKAILVIACLLAFFVVFSTAPAFGLGLYNVYMTSSATKHTIQSDFLGGCKASGNLGTVKNKTIQQCYVRMHIVDNKTKKIVSGSDTNRVYSKHFTRDKVKKGTIISSKKLEKKRASNKTVHSYYGWVY